MATGRAPFIGETAAVIFDEILRRGGATEEADTDTLANSGTVLASFPHNGALNPTAFYTQSQTIMLPPAFEGRYHLFVRTDAALYCLGKKE